MSVLRRPGSRFRPSLPFVLLCVLLGALWLAGGASRADALGQVVVRSVSWAALVTLVLFGERPAPGRAGPVLWLLVAAALLPLVQLIPLPPGLWQALPGRAVLAEAAVAAGEAQPWRPWSITPGATANALASLVVPAAVLLLVTGLREEEEQWLPGLLLGLVVASTLVGLLQFSGGGFENPFANDTPGQVGGMFANRNHFALFTAFGCLLVPAWVFLGGRRGGWRGPVGIGLLLLLLLTILASGSRAGIGVGFLALGIALLFAYRGLRRELERFPRWVLPALVAAVLGTIVVVVLVSVAADRAVSISRALAVDPGQDMRTRGLPTVLAMVRDYFPFGSGLGGFDPVFRMHEPFGLLKLTYFNHAHNDLLEVVLDAGLPGLLLLLVAIGWWARASERAWRAGRGTRRMLPKLGSAILLLVLIASVFDYPARTPLIMAVAVIAALWLKGVGRQALPADSQHL